MEIDFILIDILKYLDVTTLARLRCINKLYKSIIDDENTVLYDNYHLVYLNDYSKECTNNWLKKTILNNHITQLNLLLCENIPLARILLKSINPKYLKDLVIPLAIFQTNTDLIRLTNLTSLTVKNLYFNERGMEYNIFLIANLAPLVNLRKIKFNSIKYISAEFINYLTCRLSYLDLRECMEFKIEDVELYLLKQKNTLSVLKLDGENSNINNLINLLPELTNLTELSISYCENFTDEFLYMLSSITIRYTKLTLRKLRGISAKCFEDFFRGSCLFNLTKLDFYDACFLNNKAVSYLTKAVNLRYLDVSWTDQILNNSIKSILISCTQLEKIYLQGCKLLDENLFLDFISINGEEKELATKYRFENLKYINLTKCDLIPDKVLDQLMTQYTWITLINYYGRDLKDDNIWT